MDIHIHNVTRIELSVAFPSNGNCRTFRIVSEGHDGNEIATDITVYGQTDVLDQLPRATDFRHQSDQNARWRHSGAD